MARLRTLFRLRDVKTSEAFAPDRVIADLAARQHGVVARVQLLAAGLTREMIDGRIARGSLHRIHQGVYAVGHAKLTQEGRYMAAVLACGEGAALSRQSAAAHWRIADYRGRIVVTAPGRRGRRKGTPFTVRRGALYPDEVTTHDGIPVTTVSRTLIDLAGSSTLERAIREAEFHRLFDLGDLERLLMRHRNATGTRRLREVVRLAAEERNRTRSDLEDRFLELARRAKLPPPDVNATVELPVGTIEADMVWRDRRLIVELDGWQGHGTRRAFEEDRQRDLALAAEGWTAVRVTWRGLARGLPADLVRLLRARSQ
jgi:predicted transcriptional regulator of viral defense system